MTRMESEQVTDYGAHWQFLRHQYRALWALSLAFFPAVGGIGLGLSAWLGSAVPLFAIALCWAFPMAVVNLRFAGFTCPRCGLPFFRRDGPRRPSAFEPCCVHCGLPKWAADPAEGRRQ
jgi:hypothetical protein